MCNGRHSKNWKINLNYNKIYNELRLIIKKIKIYKYNL